METHHPGDPVPSFSSFSVDGFRQFCGDRGQPALIKSCMGNWPALHKWTPEHFEHEYGHINVTVRRCRERTDHKSISLAAYIRSLYVPEDDPYYLRDWEFEKDCPALLADYPKPECFASWHERLPEQVRPRWRWIFIGHPGTGSRMHVDVGGTSAWNALTYGRKRWLFWSPEQAPFLYGGAVNAFQPDWDRFPRFAEARALECVQEPGDIVVTPARWWHQVRNETLSIAVTENFVNHTNIDVVDNTLQHLFRLFPGKPAAGGTQVASSL